MKKNTITAYCNGRLVMQWAHSDGLSDEMIAKFKEDAKLGMEGRKLTFRTSYKQYPAFKQIGHS